MAFLLFNAFVSQTLPKLALSGYSGHLSSLLVLKQCPVTKKKKAAFHFGVISIYYKVNLFFFFNPRRSESCLVSVDAPVWPHAAPPLFSLHDPSVCMHYLSVCPLPHTSTRDQALKDFHCIQTIFISLLLSVSNMEEFGCFPCCAFTCSEWIIKPGRLKLNKSQKEIVSSTDNRFYCIYVENELFGGMLCKL